MHEAMTCLLPNYATFSISDSARMSAGGQVILAHGCEIDLINVIAECSRR